jgi:hypothetical protein
MQSGYSGHEPKIDIRRNGSRWLVTAYQGQQPSGGYSIRVEERRRPAPSCICGLGSRYRPPGRRSQPGKRHQRTRLGFRSGRTRLFSMTRTIMNSCVLLFLPPIDACPRFVANTIRGLVAVGAQFSLLGSAPRRSETDGHPLLHVTQGRRGSYGS